MPSTHPPLLCLHHRARDLALRQPQFRQRRGEEVALGLRRSALLLSLHVDKGAQGLAGIAVKRTAMPVKSERVYFVQPNALLLGPRMRGMHSANVAWWARLRWRQATL